jgi:hypothetical protein
MNSTGLSVAKAMIKSDDPVTVEAGFLFSNQSATIKTPVLDIYKVHIGWMGNRARLSGKSMD